MASSALTFPPPPDSPKIVTLDGSPPNSAMLSRTQRNAAIRSSCPALPRRCETLVGVPRHVRVAENIQPVIDRNDDDVALGGEVVAVVDRHPGRTARVAATVHPHHHRSCRSPLRRGNPDIEAQTVLAHRGCVDPVRIRVRAAKSLHLSALISEVERTFDTAVAGRRRWRKEAVGAGRRGGIGDAFVLGDPVDEAAAQRALSRLA